MKETHQAKYDNILQYFFDGKKFVLIKVHPGIREACRETGADFRAIQKCVKIAQQHHGYFWVKESEKGPWLKIFLKRYPCSIAKLDLNTGEIIDSALSIREFSNKYGIEYDGLYHRINSNKREKEFLRITPEYFAKINNLSL